MNSRIVHELDIIHRWQEIDRIDSGNGNFQIVRKCLDCGVETQAFVLGRTIVVGASKQRSSDIPDDKQIAMFNEIQRELTETVVSVRKFTETKKQLLIDGTKFSDFDDLANEIDKRYGGKLDARKLPYSQLEYWVDQGTKKFQAKAMLQYKQGPVCNRCKSIRLSLSELTLDHIDGNRSNGSVRNLQLLCRECHDDKHRNGPTRHDVSPFRFSGETTIIRIACSAMHSCETHAARTDNR